MVINLTFVGSFPLRNTKSNIIRATKDILAIPVDYPNYIQLEDMGDQFLIPLSKANSGLYRENGVFRIKSNLSVPKKQFTSYAIQTLIELSKKNQFSGQIKGVKASITGPFTLASRIMFNNQNNGSLNNSALSEINLIWDLAKIVGKIANDYRKIGVNYITIDEPILSIIIGKRLLIKDQTENHIIEIINKTVKGIKGVTGVHVCGRISRKLVEILLRTEINILDHEFRDIPENLKIFNRRDFDDSGKKISMGLASSRVQNIESVKEIYSLLSLGISKYGFENIIMIKPDCGFRGLDPDGSIKGTAYQAALAKLRNLRTVLDSLNENEL